MWSLLQKNGPRRRLLEIRLSPCHEAVRDGLAVHDRNEDIRCRFHLTPNLLNVMTSAIPALLHIRSVRIETTPVGVMVVGFRILVRRKPPLDSSCTQTNSLRDPLHLHPLLPQPHHLLLPIIPLTLATPQAL